MTPSHSRVDSTKHLVRFYGTSVDSTEHLFSTLRQVLIKLESVLSSVTLWTTCPKPLGAFADSEAEVPETPNFRTQNPESKYLKPRSFLLETPNHLDILLKTPKDPLPYLKPRIYT